VPHLSLKVLAHPARALTKPPQAKGAPQQGRAAQSRRWVIDRSANEPHHPTTRSHSPHKGLATVSTQRVKAAAKADYRDTSWISAKVDVPRAPQVNTAAHLNQAAAKRHRGAGSQAAMRQPRLRSPTQRPKAADRTRRSIPGSANGFYAGSLHRCTESPKHRRHQHPKAVRGSLISRMTMARGPPLPRYQLRSLLSPHRLPSTGLSAEIRQTPESTSLIRTSAKIADQPYQQRPKRGQHAIVTPACITM